MRQFRYTLLTIFALLFSFSTLQAQLFEDFESGDKTFYNGESVTLATGDWFLDDALLGNLSNDKFNGSQGVRMDRRSPKMGNIYMQFDKPNGAEDVSFYLAHYGSRAEDAALQVQYSVDGGSSWTNIGDEIAAPEELTEFTIPVQVAGDIRFKFIQSSGTDRMNIDDIRITDYIEPTEEPTVAVSIDGVGIQTGSEVNFSATSTTSTRTKDVEIMNLGNQDLVISEVTVSGTGFSISNALADSSLSFKESAVLTLTYAPESVGAFQGQLVVESNATNQSTFSLNITGESFEDGDPISIAEARELPFGTRVTVGGRVTVANEFGGPSHIQDETAAIGVYWTPLHSAVELGDSVVVTGPLTEFDPIGGTPGDFLMQIAEYQGDDDITFEIITTETQPVTPEVITIAEMNSGNYEAQLVEIQNVTVNHEGAFNGERNYNIQDASGQGLIRIDGDVNSLVGAMAPDVPVNIIGVVDQFNGDYQLKPRSADDLGVEEVVYPGEDVSKEETFEVVTWNIEYFGSNSGGPEDLDTQYANVKTVIDSLDADLYAFQEISSTSRFASLVNELEVYGGVISGYSQTQKTAYLFKRATIDSLNSGELTTNMTQSNWANGRFPLFFQFNATIGGETREIYSYNIHAKAFDDLSSYNQRENASRELKQYLDNARSADNVLIIGDYNDTITGSITSGEDSPYANFDTDTEYTIITKSLEEQGLASQSIGSFIDHITITSELSDEYIPSTERVENTSYIGSYLSSTSDHFPIWTRFQFEQLVSNEDELVSQPVTFSLEQNYPNPFNPTTVISYNLAENSTVTLQVFDVLGREVATLTSGERMTAGNHKVMFDASNLSSGVYIYQLSTDNGQSIIRKMTLIK